MVIKISPGAIFINEKHKKGGAIRKRGARALLSLRDENGMEKIIEPSNEVIELRLRGSGQPVDHAIFGNRSGTARWPSLHPRRGRSKTATSTINIKGLIDSIRCAPLGTWRGQDNCADVLNAFAVVPGGNCSEFLITIDTAEKRRIQ
ncbi:hypothetical protein ACJJTC_010958 [Scirpophaga incertulas]